MVLWQNQLATHAFIMHVIYIKCLYLVSYRLYWAICVVVNGKAYHFKQGRKCLWQITCTQEVAGISRLVSALTIGPFLADQWSHLEACHIEYKEQVARSTFPLLKIWQRLGQRSAQKKKPTHDKGRGGGGEVFRIWTHRAERGYKP